MKIYNKFEDFVTEMLHTNLYEDLILEGGAAGHMSHPFDDRSLTFGDFKKLIEAGLSGELNFEEDPTEKTDGQNVLPLYKMVKLNSRETKLNLLHQWTWLHSNKSLMVTLAQW